MENNLEEVEVLTKRFKDYIDKVHVTLDSVIPNSGGSGSDSSGKFYTVVSPADVMTDSLKSVLSALEKAIVNIEKISGDPDEGIISFAEVETATGENNHSEVSMTNKLFSTDELEFLEKTFNKILNASTKERNRIFQDLDKIGNP